ncbi:MAG: hypothetical protein IIA90_02835 [Chloroflexi bacterium]|nr:hypothetical protein [Chloroflexota bacterium]
MNFYSHEKIRELEEARRNARLAIEATLGRPRRRTIFGPAAVRVGRTLRRLGEGLESWASPPPTKQDSEPLSFDQR